MRCRELAAGATMLVTPHIARPQSQRTLKYVPGVGLTVLDPIWSGGIRTMAI